MRLWTTEGPLGNTILSARREPSFARRNEPSKHRAHGRHRDLRDVFESVWRLGVRDGGDAPGPVLRAHRAAAFAGWTWAEPFCFVTAAGERLPFLDMPVGRWEHEVRDALRRAVWREAEERRCAAASVSCKARNAGPRS